MFEVALGGGSLIIEFAAEAGADADAKVDAEVVVDGSAFWLRCGTGLARPFRPRFDGLEWVGVRV